MPSWDLLVTRDNIEVETDDADQLSYVTIKPSSHFQKWMSPMSLLKPELRSQSLNPHSHTNSNGVWVHISVVRSSLPLAFFPHPPSE